MGGGRKACALFNAPVVGQAPAVESVRLVHRCGSAGELAPARELPQRRVTSSMYHGLFCASGTSRYTQTQLFLTPPPKSIFLTSPCQGSDLSSLGRLIMKKQGLSDVAVANPSRGCSMIFEGLPNARRPLMVRAALLRRSCDGVAAATELRRPAPSRSFCVLSRPRRS